MFSELTLLAIQPSVMSGRQRGVRVGADGPAATLLCVSAGRGPNRGREEKPVAFLASHSHSFIQQILSEPGNVLGSWHTSENQMKTVTFMSPPLCTAVPPAWITVFLGTRISE